MHLRARRWVNLVTIEVTEGLRGVLARAVTGACVQVLKL